MGLETATYVGDLVPTNPLGSDGKNRGDDHLRLIKLVLQATFAGFGGIVFSTGTEAQGATTNNYVVTLATSPTSYHDKMVVVAKATHTNTGPIAFGVNTLAEAAVSDLQGNALAGGEIVNGNMFAVIYDDGATTWRLLTPNDRVSKNGDTIASLTVTNALAAGATTLASLIVSGTATGTTPTAGDNTTKFATTEYVVVAIMNALLSSIFPGQTGMQGLGIVTDGSAANWGVISQAHLSNHAAGIV